MPPTDAGLAQEGGDSPGEAAAAALLAVGEGEEQGGAVLVVKVDPVGGSHHQVDAVLERTPAHLAAHGGAGPVSRRRGGVTAPRRCHANRTASGAGERPTTAHITVVTAPRAGPLPGDSLNGHTSLNGRNCRIPQRCASFGWRGKECQERAAPTPTESAIVSLPAAADQWTSPHLDDALSAVGRSAGHGARLRLVAVQPEQAHLVLVRPAGPGDQFVAPPHGQTVGGGRTAVRHQ